jgi:hypothetical protein
MADHERATFLFYAFIYVNFENTAGFEHVKLFLLWNVNYFQDLKVFFVSMYVGLSTWATSVESCLKSSNLEPNSCPNEHRIFTYYDGNKKAQDCFSPCVRADHNTYLSRHSTHMTHVNFNRVKQQNNTTDCGGFCIDTSPVYGTRIYTRIHLIQLRLHAVENNFINLRRTLGWVLSCPLL